MMDMLIATAIAVVSHSLFFLAGLAVANYYNDKAETQKKDALERQYLRLRANADADDPCKPYKANARCSVKYVLPENFEDTLKTTGKATAILNKRNIKQTEITSA